MLLSPEAGWLGRVKSMAAGRLRRYMIAHGDPLIRYTLDGTELWLPLSHELPYIRQGAPQYSSNLARIAARVSSRKPDFTLVDIGANVGDGVAMARLKAHFPILCIEGSDRLFPILQMNIGATDDVALEHAFVGAETGPVQAGVHHERGTAYLVPMQHGAGPLRVETLSTILARHPRFAAPGMIKIDTDGMDCLILKAELALLAKCKPVLFFEYDPYSFVKQQDDGFGIFKELHKIGYEIALIYENNGDYLLTGELANRRLLEDLHEFYSGRTGHRYCDVCAFHRDRSEMAEEVRAAEIRFFREFRAVASRVSTNK